MWKEIEGFEGFYEVSNKGEIRSLDREVMFKHKTRFYKGAIKKQQTGANGYKIVKLYKSDKKQYTFSVHRLVANAFLDKPSYAECINHKDGNKTNNNVDNLEWCSYSHNNKHAFEIGLRKYNGNLDIYHKLSSIKVVAHKDNKILHIKDNSREMAEYIKKVYNIESNTETIARSIRRVCKINEIGIENVKPCDKRKSAYGIKFSYYKDYS